MSSMPLLVVSAVRRAMFAGCSDTNDAVPLAPASIPPPRYPVIYALCWIFTLVNGLNVVIAGQMNASFAFVFFANVTARLQVPIARYVGVNLRADFLWIMTTILDSGSLKQDSACPSPVRYPPPAILCSIDVGVEVGDGHISAAEYDEAPSSCWPVPSVR